MPTSLQEERKNLHSEIEGRGLRVYPNVVADYESPIRLRKALEESSASVHFMGPQQDDFADRQLQTAVQLGKPTIVASSVQAETRRGPEGSPDPIWLGHGNPTIAIANALDQVLGRGRRVGAKPRPGPGQDPVIFGVQAGRGLHTGLVAPTNCQSWSLRDSRTKVRLRRHALRRACPRTGGAVVLWKSGQRVGRRRAGRWHSCQRDCTALRHTPRHLFESVEP